MTTATWNPNRYIEYFGSKEKLQIATGLNDRAFHKTILSKKINIALKSYLDHQTNFKDEERYDQIPSLIEKGFSKSDLVAKFNCSNDVIIKELETRFGTRDTYIIRRALNNKRKEIIKTGNINEDVLFAVKTFKDIKAIKTFLCLSERGTRHKLQKVFGTSSLLGIRYILDQ